MTDIMYELPSMKDIKKCIITEECITKNELPDLVKKENANAKPKHIAVENKKEA